MKRILIFANPIAGRGRGKAIAERLHARLVREGFDPEIRFEPPGGIPDEQLKADAAIAIGGDGTIRGVAARLYQAFPQRPIPMLVVPMGTANLLGRHLGIDWSPRILAEQVAQALAQKRIVRIDAARANGELFLLMAGVGIDAKIVHLLDRIRRGPIDITSYVLPTALALGFYSFPSLTVTVDGKAIAQDQPAVAFVGNVKEYGTGFPILPLARPDDSLLDVCVLPCSTHGDLILHLMRAIAGEHHIAEGSIYTKGTNIRIDSTEQVPVQIDGDAAGHTPVEIDLLPVRLPFIVPG
jgi:diacylglycerol kinase (ATP)